MKFIITSLVLASASSVLGHATFQALWVNGVDQAATCVRPPKSNSPVQDVKSNDLRCNVGGSVGVPGICKVPAGASMTVEMHQQPGDRACGTEAIGGAHHGPLSVYMSKVADAKTADGSSTWFKVAAIGFNSANGLWADDVINANCGKYTFDIPADLAAGDYLVRPELIALHAAGDVGGAQFYTSCYQITVGGSGTRVPAGQVSIPGVYSADDPSIKINIYYPTVTDYKIPGPAII